MAKKPTDQIGVMIREVEDVAKRLRAGLRKQAAALPKELKTLAQRLRKGAAQAAAHVEKYAHQARIELEGTPRSQPRKRSARKAA